MAAHLFPPTSARATHDRANVDRRAHEARAGTRAVRHAERGPLTAALLRVVRPAHAAPTRRAVRPRGGRTYPAPHTPDRARVPRKQRGLRRSRRAGRASVVALVAAAATGVGLLFPIELDARVGRRGARLAGGSERPPEPAPSPRGVSYRLPPALVTASHQSCTTGVTPCGDTLRLAPNQSVVRAYSGNGFSLSDDAQCRVVGSSGVTCAVVGWDGSLQVRVTGLAVSAAATLEIWQDAVDGSGQFTWAHTTVLVGNQPAPPPPPPGPGLHVDAGYTNHDTQLLDRCAASCFAAVAGHSTVPYFSADVPRSVRLVYHGDRLAVRPFVYADASLGAGSATASELWLEAAVNGSAVTFTNGDQRLRFAGAGASSGVVRLAGQLDASGFATGVYPLTLTVGAVYTNGTTEQKVVATKLLVVNERASPVARGWTVAGVPRLHVQGDGSALHTDGAGSAVHFASCGADCFTTPAGDFSRLTAAGAGTARTYARAFADSTKVEFDYAGRATRVVDRFGNQVAFGYDGAGRLTSITDPVRRTPTNQPSATVLTYGAYGLAGIQEPGADGTSGAGRVTAYTVASDSTLRVAKDPDGDSTRFGYDGLRRLSTVTDRRGQTTTYAYAPSWKLASVQLPAVTVGQGATVAPTTTFAAWQAVGVPTASTAGALATPARRDTIRGAVTGARGAAVRFTVDRWGQPLAVTDPLGQTTTTVRSGLFPVTITHPSGGVDSLVYSGQFLTVVRAAGGPLVSYVYGAYGQVAEEWVNGIRTRRAVLDPATGLATSVQVPTVGGGSLHSAFGYNARGQVTATTEAAFGTTQYVRDNRTGNVTQVNAPDARWMSRTPDAAGRDSVLRAVDGSQRRILYDAENRVTSDADSSGTGWRTTTRGYNPLDLVRFKDAGTSVHRFGVNALGWRTQLFDPADTLSRVQALEYDAGGLVTAATNRRGQRRTFSYDALGRLVSRTAPAGGGTAADSFAVSADGRIAAAWNAVARDSQFFAPSGWRDSAVTWLGGTRYRRTYTPDAHMRLSQMTLSAASGGTAQLLSTRTYTTDPGTGLLTGVGISEPNGNAWGVSFQYDAQNRRTQANYGYAVIRTDAYTSDGRVYETSLGNLSAKRRFGYDSAGRVRLSVQVLANGAESNWRYRYDPAGQLAAADTVTGYNMPGGAPQFGYRVFSASPRAGYAYDAAGNRTSPGGLTYGPGNRATSGATFDLDGNVTSNGGGQYFWNAANLLDSVRVGGRTVRYRYDAHGRMVQRAVDSSYYDYYQGAYVQGVGAPVWYLWDGDDLIFQGVGSVGAQFVYAGGVDRPVAELVGGGVRYPHLDAQGNVFAVTAGFGPPVSYRYDPWGAPLGSTQPGVMRHGWKGMLWEPEAGLYYARNRWYHAASGRFLTEDPIGLAGGANLYAFAGNDPVNAADPYGLDGCDVDKFTLEDGWQTVWIGGQPYCARGGGVGSGTQALPTVTVTAPWTPAGVPMLPFTPSQSAPTIGAAPPVWRSGGGSTSGSGMIAGIQEFLNNKCVEASMALGVDGVMTGAFYWGGLGVLGARAAVAAANTNFATAVVRMAVNGGGSNLKQLLTAMAGQAAAHANLDIAVRKFTLEYAASVGSSSLQGARSIQEAFIPGWQLFNRTFPEWRAACLQ